MSQTILHRLQQQLLVLSQRLDALESEGGVSSTAVSQPIPGPRGPQGPTGKAGNNGRDGRDGLDGQNGVAGKDGKDAIDGIDGRDGKDAKDGKDGVDGRDGKNGDDGAPGAPGLDGKQGLPGTPGKDGLQGPPGKSCSCRCPYCQSETEESGGSEDPPSDDNPASQTDEPDQESGDTPASQSDAPPQESVEAPESGEPHHQAEDTPASQSGEPVQEPYDTPASQSDDTTEESGKAPASQSDETTQESGDTPASQSGDGAQKPDDTPASQSDDATHESGDTPASQPDDTTQESGDTPASQSEEDAQKPDDTPASQSDDATHESGDEPTSQPDDTTQESGDTPASQSEEDAQKSEDTPASQSEEDAQKPDDTPASHSLESTKAPSSESDGQVKKSEVSPASSPDVTSLVEALISSLIFGPESTPEPAAASTAEDVHDFSFPIEPAPVSDSDTGFYVVSNVDSPMLIPTLIIAPETDTHSEDFIAPVSAPESTPEPVAASAAEDVLDFIFSIESAPVSDSDTNFDVVPDVISSLLIPFIIAPETASPSEAFIAPESAPFGESEELLEEIDSLNFLTQPVSESDEIIQSTSEAPESSFVQVFDSLDAQAGPLESSPEPRGDVTAATPSLTATEAVLAGEPLGDNTSQTALADSASASIAALTATLAAATTAAAAASSDLPESNDFMKVSPVSMPESLPDVLPVLSADSVSSTVLETPASNTDRILQKLISIRPTEVAASLPDLDVTDSVMNQVAPTISGGVRDVLQHFIENLLLTTGGLTKTSQPDVYGNPVLCNALEQVLKDLGDAEDLEDFVAKQHAAESSPESQS